ncbi:uncharacterized protein LOC109859834 [Pseudomyrmex gracilis]|uniref:uncharacterized protein LOC109859834 n=1 Tax=Pseudomyrmex gracilis TaxID=219809 RepID=UPI0009953888|nr:uncharacterized protein LOC109859834 [Pseudomyrmex gracilis]
MYITTISVLMKLLLGWWFTEKFKVCQQKLAAIHETLRQLGFPVNYNKLYFIMIGILVTWIIFFFISCVLVFIFFEPDVFGHFDRLYVTITFSYGVCIGTVVILEFYINIRGIQMKFESINRLLWENSKVSLSTKEPKDYFEMNDFADIMNCQRQKHIFAGNILKRYRQKSKSQINISVMEKQKNSIKSQAQSDRPFQFQDKFREEIRIQRQEDYSAKIEHRIYLLQIIKQIHLELCRISKTLCTIFGVQIANEIALTIMFLTGSLYNLYIQYIMKYKLSDHLTEQTIATLTMGLLDIIKLFFLSRACKTTADEGNKTIEIIHSMYGCDANADLKDEIQQFGIQLLHSPVAFTAFGLPLDNTVLTRTLRYVTTYLVITIQVSNSLESNKTIQHARI